MKTVTLTLPEELLQSAQEMALIRDTTVAKIVEELLVRELPEWVASSNGTALNDRVIFSLQTLLFRDMAEATSWDDLSDRMESHGYWLNQTPDGLTVHTSTSGRALCKCTDLGFGDMTFARRFGAGRPRTPYDTDVAPPAGPDLDEPGILLEQE